jgi:hypothetical protein
VAATNEIVSWRSVHSLVCGHTPASDLEVVLRHAPGYNRTNCLMGASTHLITLMMEAASTYEMSVNFYQTTRHNNAEDSHLHTRHHENLKSNLVGLRLFHDSALSAKVVSSI